MYWSETLEAAQIPKRSAWLFFLAASNLRHPKMSVGRSLLQGASSSNSDQCFEQNDVDEGTALLTSFVARMAYYLICSKALSSTKEVKHLQFFFKHKLV